SVGHADHRLGEVVGLVAHRVIHRAVGRARHAFGDVPGAAVHAHAKRPVWCLVRKMRRTYRSARAAGGSAFAATIALGFFDGGLSPMLVHPQFDPVALDLWRIGIPIAVHWYGLTYLVAFALFLWLARLRVARPPFSD